jgi:hypothetical protein
MEHILSASDVDVCFKGYGQGDTMVYGEDCWPWSKEMKHALREDCGGRP